MNWVEIVGFLVVLLLMGVGLVGSVLPGLPGPPLIMAMAVVHRLCFGAGSVSNLVLALLLGLTLMSLLLDYLGSLYGARRLGATWRGVLGAALGALAGIFFGLPGMIVGPFLGATLFELASGRPFEQASRAGFGAMLGLLAGAVGKVACCLAMIGLFTLNVLTRALSAGSASV